MSSVSNLYERARDVATGTIDLEVSWGTIMYLTVLAVLNIFVTSMGRDIFSRCDSIKGDEVQKRFDMYLGISTVVGFAIPFTLMITKFVNGEARAFTMLYALMGVIGSAAITNWTQKCNEIKPSEERYARVSIGIFIFLMLFAILFLR